MDSDRSPPHRPHAVLAVALLAIAITGTLGALAGWLLRSGDEGDAPSRRISRTTSSSELDPAPAETAATRDPVDGVAARALDLPPCEPGPADGVPVRAIADDDGRPLPGARIFVVPAPAASKLTLQRDVLRYFEEPARLAEAGARGVLADEHGVARITWPPFEAFLIGFAGDRRGARALVEPTRDAFELRLRRPIDLQARVVDAKGNPVPDARVACATRNKSVNDDRAAGSVAAALDRMPVQYHEGGLTDSRGVARVGGVEAALELHRSLARDHDLEFDLVVPYLGSLEAMARRELRDPEQTSDPQLVELKEPFGIVEVRVVDAQGRRDESTGDVILRAQGLGDVFFVVASGVVAQRRPLRRGVARFAPVALSKKLQVSLRLDDDVTLERSVDGPSEAGEVVRVEFDLARTRCRVHGRLVGLPTDLRSEHPADPIALSGEFEHQVGGANLGARMIVRDFTDPRNLPCTVRMLPDSGFEVDATAADLDRIRALHLHGFDREHVFAFRADVEFPAGLAAPEFEVGDVAVVPEPVVAWGRVVDDLRRPIAGVQISVTSSDSTASIRRAGDYLWTQSDGKGEFALVGTTDLESPQLFLEPPTDYVRGAFAIAPDPTEMVCVLTRTGSIVGTLAADRSIGLFAAARDARGERSDTEVEYEPNRESVLRVEYHRNRESIFREQTDPEAPRPFLFTLRPGRYDLFASSNFNSPRNSIVLWVEDLEVRPGETTLDPRLSPLVVSRAEMAWRITLSRSDGAPPPAAWVRLARPDDPTKYWRSEFVANGSTKFEAALESGWIDVDAVSFRRVHELHARGDVAIVLEPLEQREVEIALDAGDAPHSYDLHWIVAADSSRPLPGFLRENYSTTVTPGGTSSLSLDEGERWRIRLFAQIDAGGAPRRVELARCMQEVSTRGDASETPAKLQLTVHADEVDSLWQELSSSK